MFICLHLFIDYNLTTNSKISYIHQLASLYLIKVAKFLWEHIGSKWGTAYNMYNVFFSYKYLVTIVLIGPTICFTKIPCKNTSFCFVYYCFFFFIYQSSKKSKKDTNVRELISLLIANLNNDLWWVLVYQ